jgi:hypothetical protein
MLTLDDYHSILVQEVQEMQEMKVFVVPVQDSMAAGLMVRMARSMMVDLVLEKAMMLVCQDSAPVLATYRVPHPISYRYRRE